MKLNDLGKRFINHKDKIPQVKWSDSRNYLTYEEAFKNAKAKNLGIMVVLGPIDNDYTLAGIDFDSIQDIRKGIIDFNIKKDIEPFKHIHNSLSGYGLHILCLIKNDFKLDKGNKTNIKSKLNISCLDEEGKPKIPGIEFYIGKRLFALPLDLNANLDNIVESTENYKNLYNKYFENKKKYNSQNKISIKDKSPSGLDYSILTKAYEKGYSKEEMKSQYLESDFANNLDPKHKEKVFGRIDYLDRTIDNVIKDSNENQDDNKNVIDDIKEKQDYSKNDIILDLIKDKELFVDERDTAYIVVNYKNIRIESKEFERYITFECIKNKIGISKNIILNAQFYISNKAIEESNRYNLNVRFAGDENTIYYQLSNKEVVKITPNAYEIIENDYPRFRWFKSMQEQVAPQVSDITFEELLKHFNLEEEQKLLFKVYIVSLFIPDIPKPIFILNAERGAGKTTTTKFIKRLVDPSVLETISFPTKQEELPQILDHNAVICFDNIDRLQFWQSDALCRAYSGDSMSKRTAFTVDEDYIYQFKRAIILNGINCPATREDLLDRSILINLKRPNEFKTERVICNEWNALKPRLLHLIFDTISKALPIYHTTNEEDLELGRTADWCKWGYCIAETMEKGLGNTFLKDYNKNISNQNSQVIENNVLVEVIIELMRDKREYEKLANELFIELKMMACNYGSDYFPKSSSWLTRDLNRFSNVLESQNIKFSKYNTNKGSCIKLSKIK